MKYAELIAQLIAQGKFEPPPEPPLFDWREFKGKAEEIIKEVGRDIRMISVRGDRRRKGENLSTDEAAHETIVESLARLLAEAAEEYLNAKTYCEVMDAPRKRYRPSVAKKPMKYPKGYDYSACQSVEETARQYDEMLALFPKRKPGARSVHGAHHGGGGTAARSRVGRFECPKWIEKEWPRGDPRGLSRTLKRTTFLFADAARMLASRDGVRDRKTAGRRTANAGSCRRAVRPADFTDDGTPRGGCRRVVI